MSLLVISRKQLLFELYESKKMIYRIINLPPQSQSLISMSISPFLSLLCDGIDSLFSEGEIKLSEGMGNIGNISFTKLMTQNRASIKLLTDKKISNAVNRIDEQIISFNNSLTDGYGALEKNFISIFGQPDLGVYFFRGISFSNTSQLSIYQDMFRKITDNNMDDQRLGLILRDFSAAQTSFINSFVSQTEGSIFPIINVEDCNIDINDSDFSEKDFIFYNEAKRNIFTKYADKDIILYLLNLKCQLSFALKIIPEIIDRKSSLRLRIEMITYYQSAKTIEFLIKKNKIPLNKKAEKVVEGILIDFKSIFLGNSLRSNIYHYKLSDDNLKMSLDNDFFISMVEFQTKKSFNLVFENIEKNMMELVRILDEITVLD
ncbi:hypothetical protein [Lactococcus petauri]|uniref:hypothetical protein n=1 Tax=Lactococcus petauri TaxID=1940789 RepID=UPI0022E6C5C1|nr:hypothetical protein [Lactococcus petauri]